ncbi:MAG: hypothetical protein HY336_02715 [Candidatus Doudnabacteria bacterium]|nr:hypothetical protein [Candidatus Doudnabacteria bacterium]
MAIAIFMLSKGQSFTRIRTGGGVLEKSRRLFLFLFFYDIYGFFWMLTKNAIAENVNIADAWVLRFCFLG